MITISARVWLAIAGFALIAAEVYFLATGGEDGGAVTLLFLAVGAIVLAAAGIATNDGDAALPGDEGETEAVVVRSALPAIWPALGAIGAGVTIVGYAAGGLLLYVGFGILAATLVEWMVQSWAERSSADPAYNTALRNRIMFPIEIPVFGLGAVALVILTFSRVLLAVPKNGSIIIAGVVATLILTSAFIIANRPKLSSGALSWLLAVAAVVLLAAGVIGGVSGERKIGEHEGAQTEETTTTTGVPTP
jgi:hypothetical protein